MPSTIPTLSESYLWIDLDLNTYMDEAQRHNGIRNRIRTNGVTPSPPVLARLFNGREDGNLIAGVWRDLMTGQALE